jgi:hypothetical protein
MNPLTGIPAQFGRETCTDEELAMHHQSKQNPNPDTSDIHDTARAVT